ncbi:MAG: glycosyl hydrolase family 39 [Acidobacteriaceae bacterium]|nr:glycosyl hydrolase family 39 [Acidobacteriaceae bacterium]
MLKQIRNSRQTSKAGLSAARLQAMAVMFVSAAAAQKIDIAWDKVQLVSKTTPTLQVVVNPPLRRGSPIHDRAFTELKNLGAEYVRYVPWLPYPRLAVAELDAPSNGKTSWDFSIIDPMTIDFLKATEGHSVILNFSTIPAWMFETAKPVGYPNDPDAVTWDYTQGTQLKDPSMKELGDYYARLVSWYVNGGFTDEFGKRHDSGYHFHIPYWEILNEVDFEHSTTAEQYTERYDAIASAIKKVAPDMKFVGLALAIPGMQPGMFEYFLNPRNHKPGIPLDMISYHFYAVPEPDETPEIQQHTFFTQADGFINTVRYVEAIRKRLSPQTRTTVDEIGCISADDASQGKPGHVTAAIPDSYWNLCGATYAYVFGQLVSLGIDVAGESQLVGYPTQFPSVTMLDWNSGAPNARFRVLELLKENFGPGDQVVTTKVDSNEVYALGFVCQNGKHTVLLINKRDRDVEVTLPEKAGQVQAVDETTKDGPIAKQNPDSAKLRLRPYSVAVATLP